MDAAKRTIAKIDRRRIRKVHAPAKPGRIKESLIERAIKEVMEKRPQRTKDFWLSVQ
ncbi:MAG: hypothetical protein QG657_3281 [Acidobacteriota bacterium]|nr:hypothetical protein [Acidobacteriota bacterium]